MDAAKGYSAVLELFGSGVDYWQRLRHGGHSWALKEAMFMLMLTRQRLDVGMQEARGKGCIKRHRVSMALPHLPEEMWLRACAYLRSADFGARA